MIRKWYHVSVSSLFVVFMKFVLLQEKVDFYFVWSSRCSHRSFHFHSLFFSTFKVFFFSKNWWVILFRTLKISINKLRLEHFKYQRETWFLLPSRSVFLERSVNLISTKISAKFRWAPPRTAGRENSCWCRCRTRSPFPARPPRRSPD